MDEEIIDESFFIENSLDVNEASVIKTGFENSFNDRQVGSIAVAVEPVSINVSLDSVIELFHSQPNLEAIPIEEDDLVVGVIERRSVLDDSDNPIKKRFVSKSINEYVKKCPFSLNTSDYLEKISGKVNEIAIKVEVKHLVVLLNNRSFYGLVSVAEINQKIEKLRAHDLEKAEVIQQNILQINSAVSDFPFDVNIFNKMANPVGGDFYLAQDLSDEKYVIASFDVSGKNVSAALLTVTIGSFFTLIKMINKNNLTPQKLILMLDRYLKEIVPLGNFITGCICFVDKAANTVQVYNCGHTDTVMVINTSFGKKVASLVPTLPPFGMGSISDELKNKSRTSYKLKIMYGLQINLFSDGLSDMQNDEGERFGDTRVLEFCKNLYDSEKPVDYTKSVCSEWTRECLLPDDISVINIRF